MVHTFYPTTFFQLAVCSWKTFYAVSTWFGLRQCSSFQACERVKRLGCLSAEAVDSRYDISFFIAGLSVGF